MKSLLIVIAVFTACVSAQVPTCLPDDVVLPHEDCTKYYICDNGVAVELECNDGLYFNPDFGGCDFPFNVPECLGGTRPPIGTTTAPTTTRPTTTTAPTTTRPTTTTAPTTTRPTTTTAPTTTRPTTTTAPTTTRPTTTTAPTSTTTRPPTTSAETPETEGPEPTGSTTTLAPGVCPPTGIIKIRHEEDCQKYYLCVDGDIVSESKCAEGLYFDPSIQECNMEDLVNCVSVTTLAPTTTTRPNMPECPPTGLVQLPYPGNCTLYILCIEEVPILYRCPDGMLFDYIDAQCKPEDLAVCLDSMVNKIDEVKTEVDDETKEISSYWRYMQNLVGIFRKTEN